jgi:hypothetical protein
MDKFSESNIKYNQDLYKEIFYDLPELWPLINTRYFGKDIESPLIQAEGILTEQNAAYAKSRYYYNGELSFLHFTSFKSLLSVINSQSLRLKTLNGMNDINEITYAAKFFELDRKHIEILQKEIFSFSLVTHHSSDSEIGDNTNNLDLWRFYGLDGDGVAINFKIINDPSDWISYHLSGIHYGEDGVAPLKVLHERIRAFNLKYPTIYIHLPNIFSFHKSNHFKNEDEVRLIYSTMYDFTNREHKQSLTFQNSSKAIYPELPTKIGNTEHYVSSIPLYNKTNYSLAEPFFKRAPKIVIDKIILGYRFKDEELSMYRNVITSINRLSIGFDIPMENIYITPLKELFR